jgi:hypothetical protein
MISGDVAREAPDHGGSMVGTAGFEPATPAPKVARLLRSADQGNAGHWRAETRQSGCHDHRLSYRDTAHPARAPATCYSKLIEPITSNDTTGVMLLAEHARHQLHPA